MLAEITHFARRHLHNHHQSITLLKCCCKALFQALCILVVNDELIHNHLDIMVLIPFEHHSAHHLTKLAIDADIKIAFMHHLLEKFLVMSFAATNERSQDVYLFPRIAIEQQFQNLFFGIFHHLFARQIRVGLGCTRKEQTHIIVYFGCCTYR